MSRAATASAVEPPSFPRVSGDEPAFQEANGGLEMFSPRERG